MSPTSPSTQRPTSEPRLSDITDKIFLPSGIVSTGWPAVLQKCKALGLGFDRWQSDLGRCILAKHESGLYAAGVGGIALSIPRQVGKTYLIGAIVFALCLIAPGTTVLWTAHRVKTANEVFRSMQGMAKRKAIAPFIEAVTRGSGNQGVEFRNGSRIMFGARETGFGRGFANVSIIVFDEAQILTEDTLDDMIPAANTAANPLVMMVGTPPKPTDAGEVFTNRRNEALSGESDDTMYVEISADSACDPTVWPPGHVDWDQVAKANPSYPRRTPRAAILRMLKLLGRASFRREGLGIWDDDTVKGGGVIERKEWAACLLADSELVGDYVVALDASPMLTQAAIVVAGVSRKAGRIHLEVTGARGALDYRPGTDWAVDLLGAQDGLTVWIAAGSAAEALRTDLEDAGVTVEVLDRRAYGQACVSFASAVIKGEVAHRGQTPLGDAVVAGAKRNADEGLWTWGRVKSSADITPLVAATVAFAIARDEAAYDPMSSIG